LGFFYPFARRRAPSAPAAIADFFLGKFAAPADRWRRRRASGSNRLLAAPAAPADPTPAASLALRFRIFLSVGAPAPRAQYDPHQPPVGHFVLAKFAAPATAGDRAAELGGRWQQHPARTSAVTRPPTLALKFRIFLSLREAPRAALQPPDLGNFFLAISVSR